MFTTAAMPALYLLPAESAGTPAEEKWKPLFWRGFGKHGKNGWPSDVHPGPSQAGLNRIYFRHNEEGEF